MSVLVYAPQVQLIVATDTGYYDVSGDIVSGNVSLRENASHQMSVSLMNAGRRYDKLFKPNDRFALYMKRLTKLLVMTGYLDSVPFYSAWPRTIQISGSSTLKRLQYHFWDPGTPAAVNLFNENTTNSSNNPLTGDALIVNKAMNLLTQVANWDMNKIHFASLPSQWMSKITSIAQTVFPQIGLDYATGMPIFAGQTPFTAGITSSDPTLGGTTPIGAALPAVFGAVTAYKGAQDVQPASSFYCQMEWGYQNPDGSTPAHVSPSQVKSFLAGQKLMVGSPDSGSSVIVEIAGWGPLPSTNATIGLSPDAIKALDLPANNPQVQIAWVKNPKSVPTGPYNFVTSTTANTTTPAVPSDIGKLAQLSGVSPSQLLPLQYNNPDTAYTTIPNGDTTYSVSRTGQTQSQEAKTVVNYALQQVGKPYVLGTEGPNSFDCSGLAYAAWSQVGVEIPRVTTTQWTDLDPLPADPSTWLPGDLVLYGGGNYDGSPNAPGHVAIFLGANYGSYMVVQALNPKAGVITCPLDMSYVGARRVTASNSKASPTGANAPSATGSGLVSTSGNTQQSGTVSFLSQWSWVSQAPDPLSSNLTGYRSLLNDVPLLPTIQQVTNASMRSFCSAPNGDFIAWFPDYFNVYNTLGVIKVQDIELQDFTINWSDLSMVTHQFAAGTYSPVSNTTDISSIISAGNMIQTGGVATIDFPALLEMLLNLDPNDPTFTTAGIYQRFGARPNFQSLGTLFGPQSEFWYAVYLFQQNWASQFSANVSLAFLPELYPGMILQIPPKPDNPNFPGFQVYVSQVNHSWSLGDGGGFHTSAVVTAPSALGGGGFYGLAKGGNWSV